MVPFRESYIETSAAEGLNVDGMWRAHAIIHDLLTLWPLAACASRLKTIRAAFSESAFKANTLAP